jgi:hypothetical protein
MQRLSLSVVAAMTRDISLGRWCSIIHPVISYIPTRIASTELSFQHECYFDVTLSYRTEACVQLTNTRIRPFDDRYPSQCLPLCVLEEHNDTCNYCKTLYESIHSYRWNCEVHLNSSYFINTTKSCCEYGDIKLSCPWLMSNANSVKCVRLLTFASIAINNLQSSPSCKQNLFKRMFSHSEYITLIAIQQLDS